MGSFELSVTDWRCRLAMIVAVVFHLPLIFMSGCGGDPQSAAPDVQSLAATTPLASNEEENLSLNNLKLSSTGAIQITHEATQPASNSARYAEVFGTNRLSQTYQMVRYQGVDGLVTYLEYPNSSLAEESLQMARQNADAGENSFFRMANWIVWVKLPGNKAIMDELTAIVQAAIKPPAP